MPKGPQMPSARKPHIIVMRTAEPSTIAASMTCPSPLRAASTNAQATPKAMSIPPPPKSPTRLMGGVGFDPARPKWPSAPASAM